MLIRKHDRERIDELAAMYGTRTVQRSWLICKFAQLTNGAIAASTDVVNFPTRELFRIGNWRMVQEDRSAANTYMNRAVGIASGFFATMVGMIADPTAYREEHDIAPEDADARKLSEILLIAALMPIFMMHSGIITWLACVLVYAATMLVTMKRDPLAARFFISVYSIFGLAAFVLSYATHTAIVLLLAAMAVSAIRYAASDEADVTVTITEFVKIVLIAGLIAYPMLR